MAELKTSRTDASVDEFIAGVEDKTKRADCLTLISLMADVTGDPGSMWGTSIVGFGTQRYRYASGREAEWFQVGFSPRKQNLTLYIVDGFTEYDSLLERLGKHSTGKSCLYINRLSDVDLSVLDELVRSSVAHIGQNTAG